MPDVESADNAGAHLITCSANITAPGPIDQRLTRVAITEPIPGSSQSVLMTQVTAMATPSLSHCKHKLDDLFDSTLLAQTTTLPCTLLDFQNLRSTGVFNPVFFCLD
ncbi:hypothetical protein B0H13DRAFT_2341127 [Mycena leptocephala]|nr:hypothetical protein B0H13DRAFT_2341127 [Mycena leptocephala]